MSARSAALASYDPREISRSQLPTPSEWEAFSREITVILEDPDRFSPNQIDRWRRLACSIQRFVQDIAGPDDLSLAGEESPEEICLARLSARQRQVMELVVAGRANKAIAHLLNISQRTAENHRAEVMKKTGARSLPDLVRLSLKARRGREDPSAPRMVSVSN
ncbi:MAG: response regulator transcription factor [Elsteraceae bacterium]